MLYYWLYTGAQGGSLVAYSVEVLPGPLCSVHLLVQLLSHDVLCISIVQMGQVHWRRRERGRREDKNSTESLSSEYFIPISNNIIVLYSRCNIIIKYSRFKATTIYRKIVRI